MGVTGAPRDTDEANSAPEAVRDAPGDLPPTATPRPDGVLEIGALDGVRDKGAPVFEDALEILGVAPLVEATPTGPVSTCLLLRGPLSSDVVKVLGWTGRFSSPVSWSLALEAPYEALATGVPDGTSGVAGKGAPEGAAIGEADGTAEGAPTAIPE